MVTHDGDVKAFHTKPGEFSWLTIYPVKYIYSQEIEDCREVPFNDLLLKLVVEKMRSMKCPKLPWFYWNTTEYIDTQFQIEECKTKAESLCFNKAFHGANLKTILTKPCTKIQYQLQTSTLSDGLLYADHNEIIIRMSFTYPPRATVKEEYLIFDLVSVISAIGGTMGLCIGFSFRELSHFLLDQMVSGFTSVRIWICRKKDDTNWNSLELKRRANDHSQV